MKKISVYPGNIRNFSGQTRFLKNKYRISIDGFQLFSKPLLLIYWFIIAFICISCISPNESGRRIPEPVLYDRTTKNLAGIKKSDRLIRILNNTSGPIPKEQAWKDWQANRLEWTYCNDSSFLAMIRNQGGTFAGAMASGTTDENEALQSFTGSPIFIGGVLKRYRGCMNKPSFIQKQMKVFRKWALFGVNSIQHDEAMTNFTSYHYGWATCFCDYCMKGFADYCAEREIELPKGISSWEEFHYGEYLRTVHGLTSNEEYEQNRKHKFLPLSIAQSQDKTYKAADKPLPLQKEFEHYQVLVTRNYNQKLFDVWKETTERPLVVSINMVSELTGTFGLSSCPVLDHIDYIIGEYYVATKTPAEWVHSARLADALNLEFIASIKKHAAHPTVQETRKAIALSYANGRHVLMPWDIYIHNGPRWYSDIEEYRDIISFIADNTELFDDYHTFGNAIVMVPLPRYEYEQGLISLMEAGLRQGIQITYAISGLDQYEFVHVPVDPGDFTPGTPVWMAGQSDDWSITDRDFINALITKDDINFQGNLPMELITASGDLRTQAQAMHDLNSNLQAKDEPSGNIPPSGIADETIDKMLEAGVKPLYQLSDPENIFVFPRLSKIQDAPAIVHVVNMGKAGKNVKLWIDQSISPGFSSETVEVHRPGLEPMVIGIKTEGTGWVMEIPFIQEWAIIVIRP